MQGLGRNAEADQARLSELADTPYDQVIAELTPYVGQFDSPLQKIGSTWRMASPYDAWFRLAHHLTAVDIKRFEVAAHAVLGSADPRFDMDPNERWMAAVKGVNRDYLGNNSSWHWSGTDPPGAVGRPGAYRARRRSPRRRHCCAKLLDGADQRRWWSLSREFRLLAEASPASFLSSVEDSLDQNDPPISVLFGHDEGGVFGAEHLSDLMWAMETLAWSPDWLARVTLDLAKLDALDVKPRRYSNGPANSLREIHLLWNPQTYAIFEERLRALDLIRKQEPDAAWKLMLGILPRGHDSATPSPMPKWRDFSVDKVETVTWPLIRRGADAISRRLLEDVGIDAKRWVLLLDRINGLEPGPETVLMPSKPPNRG